jgi:NAD-dependent dihydropyrimidine dehydrogenase PreA subunit
MPYVITAPCIGVKDRACVDVCPVNCIYEGDDQLYIHPGDCIDCGACEPACPVGAIYQDDAVPREWRDFVAKNADFFTAHPDAAAAVPRSAR